MIFYSLYLVEIIEPVMKEIDARRQKRMDKAATEKELTALWRKKQRLFWAKRNRTLVPLEKPVRHGYKKSFMLRPDIAKSREAHVYLGLLPHVQKHIFSKTKKFETRDYKTKKMVPMSHGLKPIEHKEWNRLVDGGLLTLKQQAMFVKRWRQTSIRNPNMGVFEYHFIKDWVFIERIDPHYKTHTLLLDPQMESELRELMNRIDTQNLMPKIGKALGWTMGCKDWVDVRKALIEKQYADMANNILEYTYD